MSEHLAALIEDEDNALQSIFWMAEEAGMTLPPLPEAYLDRFLELRPASCFATDERLLRLLDRSGLDAALEAGEWPVTGMAFRLVPIGRYLHWQLLLVGRVHLIQMTLSALLTGAEPKAFKLQTISSANDQLARYLSDEITLSRYLAAGPADPDERCQIVWLSNAGGGLATETHATWSANAGLGAARNAEVVFTYGAASVPPTDEEILLRL